MSDVRIATRMSALAIAQASIVAERLVAEHGVDVELVKVTTTGDIDRTSPVVDLTEVGAFVRAVQEAVLIGRADIAVHSCKDLPVDGPDELGVVFPRRGPVWDVLCGSTIEELPMRGRVGTGSPRRAAQLAVLRPDVEVIEIRGNVETRLAAVTRGRVEAVVLAEAGLSRLGITEFGHRFTIDEMVPAPAQGALAVEYMRDSPLGELIAVLDDSGTRRTVAAEREVLRVTGAGCRSALGVLGVIGPGDDLTLHGFVADADGARRASADDHNGPAVDSLIDALELV